MREDLAKSFFLVHKHMQQSSSLFTGSPSNRRFVRNVMALQREVYLRYGIISSPSVLQGSPGPVMFAAPIVGYIMYGRLDSVSVSVSDLPSGKVKTTLEELEAISDPDPVTLEDKDEFTRCICLHYLILSTQSEIDQFVKGLATNGVLDVIRNNPNQSCKLLQHYEHEKLTAKVVDNQFQCVFSMEGSNKHAKKEAMAFNFTHYLEDVEEGLITTTVLDPETDEIHTCPVKLNLGMFFSLLQDALPPLPQDLTLI